MKQSEECVSWQLPTIFFSEVVIFMNEPSNMVAHARVGCVGVGLGVAVVAAVVATGRARELDTDGAQTRSE